MTHKLRCNIVLKYAEIIKINTLPTTFKLNIIINVYLQVDDIIVC